MNFFIAMKSFRRNTSHSAVLNNLELQNWHALVSTLALEALEMLSSMSEGRLKGLLDILPKESTETFRPHLIEIKRIFWGKHLDYWPLRPRVV